MTGVLPLDDLLRELRLRGWTLYRWGPADDPSLVVAAHAWENYADVVILRPDETASGYRVPTDEDADSFRPAAVSFQYHSEALWVLRAMLSLDPPRHPGGPAVLQTPHKSCVLPDDLPQPLTIRPLSPSTGLAHVRSAG